jgi:hypothetical protein
MQKVCFVSAIAAALITATTAAAEPVSLDPDQLQVGTGVICDTQDEVASFLKLMTDHDPQAALTTVNRDAANPAACGMATVAFRAGKTIGEVHNGKGAFSVMQIEIVAGAVNGGWQMMAPAKMQFTAVALSGYDI